MTPPVKRSRAKGAAREALARLWAKQYEDEGMSIRQIATAAGRSYGMVHRVLVNETNVTLRGRGGNQRGAHTK